MALLHWWPLNGDLHDQGCSPATIHAAAQAVSNNNGKIGKCYYFNGNVASYLYGTANINSYQSHITIGCWVKFSSISSNQCLMSSRTAVGYGFAIFLLNGGKTIRFDNGSNSTYSQQEFSYNFAINTWYHITMVQDSTSRKLYINGNLINSVNVQAITGNTATKLLIGSSAGSDSTVATGNCLQGYLNDVRIYDEALSAEEIQQLYKLKHN